MFKKYRLYFASIAFVVLFLSFQSCGSLISSFDQYSYTQTTSIKVDAMNLMDLANEDYQLHEKDIATVQTELKKIYEYEKNRPKNEITTQMWKKILDSSGHLFGGFITRWKAEKKLNRVYIEDKKNDEIGPAFDQIAELESKKSKPTNN